MNDYLLNLDSFYTKSAKKPRRQNNYERWQSAHSVDPVPYEPSNAFKEHIVIDINVQTIGDLLDIVHRHPYVNNKTYNINLKALHLIEKELREIDNMIGMESIKTSILDQLLYFLQNLHIIGHDNNDSSDYKHTVIYGPPGTGKTHMAELMGQMYSKIGILKKNVFKKVTRSDLVAGYLGQTALKTTDVIKSCIGGCLFIDEAYSLGSDDLDSFSKECVDTLCECLSRHKNDLMVIIAGYEDELERHFFNSNKGLRSRFIWKFTIDPYGAAELSSIMKKMVNDIGWKLEDDCIHDKWFESKLKEFSHYGRDVEFLLSYVKICHSRRIFGADPSLKKRLSLNDVNSGFEMFIKHKKQKKEKVPNFYI